MRNIFVVFGWGYYFFKSLKLSTMIYLKKILAGKIGKIAEPAKNNVSEGID